MNLDKQAAMERLDAIEDEAKKLREIIEKGDNLVHDESKLYVGVYNNEPYIMTGTDEKNGCYQFHRFARRNKANTVYSYANSTAQKCLNYHINAGFEITAFDDTREAFKFFLKNL
ncbi:MAG: hypothetical protein IMZ61_04020 [Planctomycetes bacterium]|nr:hypothetical protein [Planctomycetota bacterium]